MKLSLFVPWNPSGPFNHVKSSLLGSTSDSNINKYSTIHKIPLIALNFSEGTEKKPHSPPTSETTIIAPKVKDRTHNVTKKVTQVSCVFSRHLAEVCHRHCRNEITHADYMFITYHWFGDSSVK